VTTSDDGPDREVGRLEVPFSLHSGGGGRAFLPEEWTPVLARRRGGRAYQEARGSQAAESFARKPTGCCPVANLPRNACLVTRENGMMRIGFILLSVLGFAFASGEAWAQAWPT